MKRINIAFIGTGVAYKAFLFDLAFTRSNIDFILVDEPEKSIGHRFDSFVTHNSSSEITCVEFGLIEGAIKARIRPL